MTAGGGFISPFISNPNETPTFGKFSESVALLFSKKQIGQQKTPNLYKLGVNFLYPHVYRSSPAQTG